MLQLPTPITHRFIRIVAMCGDQVKTPVPMALNVKVGELCPNTLSQQFVHSISGSIVYFRFGGVSLAWSRPHKQANRHVIFLQFG